MSQLPPQRLDHSEVTRSLPRESGPPEGCDWRTDYLNLLETTTALQIQETQCLTIEGNGLIIHLNFFPDFHILRSLSIFRSKTLSRFQEIYPQTGTDKE